MIGKILVQKKMFLSFWHETLLRIHKNDRNETQKFSFRIFGEIKNSKFFPWGKIPQYAIKSDHFWPKTAKGNEKANFSQQWIDPSFIENFSKKNKSKRKIFPWKIFREKSLFPWFRPQTVFFAFLTSLFFLFAIILSHVKNFYLFLLTKEIPIFR